MISAQKFRFFSSLRVACIILPLLFFVGNQAKGEPFNLSFRTYGLGGILPEDLYYQSTPENFEPVRFSRHAGRRSQAHPYSGTSPLIFYRFETDSEGNRIPLPRAALNLSEDTTRNLLVLVESVNPVPERGPEFALYGMLDDLTGFPLGTLKFFNATESELVGVFDQQSFRISPRALSPPFAIPEGASGSGVRVGLAEQNNNGEIRRLFHNELRFREGRRELLILAPNESAISSRPLRIFQLSDIGPPTDL